MASKPNVKTPFKLYHNPRCSKSRQTLALLEEHGIEPELILYLNQPPKSSELKSILEKLGIEPRALLRKGEDTYKTLKLDDQSLTKAALIKAMCENPILIERPIFETKTKACIGRPPENVLALI